MAGYLLGEEGPLAGVIITFEEGDKWVLGRDPDEATIVLEDPMVSRKHVICHLTPEGYVLENLSSVNPATQNGKVITEAVLLREGDILQIGSTFFHFTEKNPSSIQPMKEEEHSSLRIEGDDELSSIQLDLAPPTKWLIKVISGPNSGAEFNLNKDASYIIGKDPNLCDIVFHDLSVSRQHARITVDDQEKVFIEDLGSRNGALLNGELISEKKEVASQDVIAMGTTSFLVIDKEHVHETIVSPSSMMGFKTEEEASSLSVETAQNEISLEKQGDKNWKELVIPTKHVIVALSFCVMVIALLAATFSLFKTEPIAVKEKHETEFVAEALKNFPSIQFSFNESSGKLFLTGHVLTTIDKQELLYNIKTLTFVQNIEDNVVIDEYVWQNMNALLMANPDWQAVTIHSPIAGKFVLKGYVLTVTQASALVDYLNVNFPYLDSLENQVVIEDNLNQQIQSLLIEKGFSGVSFQLSNGELVLSGRIDDKESTAFNQLIGNFKSLNGIRQVKNFVILSAADTSRIDLSQQYTVSGFSTGDQNRKFVVINGRIFSVGDSLDGMLITIIQPNIILLEKDGLKFRINYNLQ